MISKQSLYSWRGACVVTDIGWGDNGKGKIDDLLSQKAHLNIRFNGGPNAGHTVINKQGKFVFHGLPSSILNPDTISIVAGCAVVNPFRLTKEIHDLLSQGIRIKSSQLLLSYDSHLIMPWHIVRDNLSERARGGAAIGTTGSGIGPVYADRAARIGLRMGDFLSKDFEKKLLDEYNYQLRVVRMMAGESFVADISRKKSLSEFIQLLDTSHEEENMNFDATLKEVRKARRVLTPFIGNSLPVIRAHEKKGSSILGEAGQGALLDLDLGGYPFVTSSNPGLPGFLKTTGIHYKKIDRVIGVIKVYTTRVGGGPMPTELHGKTGDYLRKKGGEFGATTGRPRRCGWFDAVAMRYGARIAQADVIALTKLDIFDNLDSIKICTGYTVKNKQYRDIPDADPEFMQQAKPLYETVPGWGNDTSKVRTFKNLPKNAQKYIQKIEELLEIPVELISVGAHRDQTIYR